MTIAGDRLGHEIKGAAQMGTAPFADMAWGLVLSRLVGTGVDADERRKLPMGREAIQGADLSQEEGDGDRAQAGDAHQDAPGGGLSLSNGLDQGTTEGGLFVEELGQLTELALQHDLAMRGGKADGGAGHLLELPSAEPRRSAGGNGCGIPDALDLGGCRVGQGGCRGESEQELADAVGEQAGGAGQLWEEGVHTLTDLGLEAGHLLGDLLILESQRLQVIVVGLARLQGSRQLLRHVVQDGTGIDGIGLGVSQTLGAAEAVDLQGVEQVDTRSPGEQPRQKGLRVRAGGFDAESEGLGESSIGGEKTQKLDQALLGKGEGAHRFGILVAHGGDEAILGEIDADECG